MRKIVGGPVVRWKCMGEQRVIKRGFGGIAIGYQPFKNPHTGKIYPFTFFQKPDGVTIFALTASVEGSQPEVILVRQFKQAIGRAVLEAPGGQVRRGEDVRAVAARELREETGFEAAELVCTGTQDGGFWVSPRSSLRVSHTFLATGCRPVGEQKLDRGEGAIEVWVCTPAEFWGLVEHGKIRSLETVIAAYRAADCGAIPYRPQT